MALLAIDSKLFAVRASVQDINPTIIFSRLTFEEFRNFAPDWFLLCHSDDVAFGPEVAEAQCFVIGYFDG